MQAAPITRGERNDMNYTYDMAQIFSLPIVRALIWLAAALVIATVARMIARAVVKRARLKPRLSHGGISAQEAEKTSARTRDFVGNLTFLLVFLLFVPAIFSSLGVERAAEPVLSFLNGLLGFLPNILGAAVILTVGLLVARLVRQLLVPVFARIRVDRLQERAGIKVRDEARLSTTLSYIVYVLIVIPVVVMALQVLDIKVISDPATHMLDMVIGFVPNVLAAALLLALGVFVAKLAGTIVEQLVGSTGVDARLSAATDGKTSSINVSRMLGMLVKVVIITLFALESLEVLQLQALTRIGAAIVAYLPNMLAACLLLGVAMVGDAAATKALASNGLGRYAPLAKTGIWVLAAFMVLTQLNIAQEIVQGGFMLVLAAVCVAFALAFGLGGREAARRMLGKWTEEVPR